MVGDSGAGVVDAAEELMEMLAIELSAYQPVRSNRMIYGVGWRFYIMWLWQQLHLSFYELTPTHTSHYDIELNDPDQLTWALRRVAEIEAGG